MSNFTWNTVVFKRNKLEYQYRWCILSCHLTQLYLVKFLFIFTVHTDSFLLRGQISDAGVLCGPKTLRSSAGMWSLWIKTFGCHLKILGVLVICMLICWTNLIYLRNLINCLKCMYRQIFLYVFDRVVGVRTPTRFYISVSIHGVIYSLSFVLVTLITLTEHEGKSKILSCQNINKEEIFNWRQI